MKLLSKKIIIAFFIMQVANIYSQNLSGSIYDAISKDPLQFASISIIGKPSGGVSNSDGQYSIAIENLLPQDSIAYSFIGYKTQIWSVKDVGPTMDIYMQPIYEKLQGVTIIANTESAESIISKMIQQRGNNYKLGNYEARIFRREQGVLYKKNFSLKLKSSTLDIINKPLIENINKKIPDSTLYFVDLLFDLFHYQGDYKLHDIKRIAQIDENVDALQKMGDRIVASIDSITPNNTYWKGRSGLFFSQRIDDTETPKAPTDSSSLQDSTIRVSVWGFENKVFWDRDFVNKPRKYNYTVEGVTNINGEQAYIIYFTPDGGRYEGEMYVSLNTYALLRVKYFIPSNIKGKGFSLLGVSLRTKGESGELIYKPYGNGYCMKYGRKLSKESFKVNRPFDIVQKRKRFLFDKNINEAKFEIEMDLDQIGITEYLVSDISPIDEKAFKAEEKVLRVRTQKVKQYNDPSIWNGYNVLPPTDAMKQYTQ